VVWFTLAEDRNQWLDLLVGFQVLAAVVMNSTTFWDITPYSPLKVNGHFGGIYRLHPEGNQVSGCHLLSR
jgi:hypothetical protein